MKKELYIYEVWRHIDQHVACRGTKQECQDFIKERWGSEEKMWKNSHYNLVKEPAPSKFEIRIS